MSSSTNPPPENDGRSSDSAELDDGTDHALYSRAAADRGAHAEASGSGAVRDRAECDKTVSDGSVDIATGEFLVPATDVALPGVLSLVLRRTHCSNYRFGRWFGPSWSATVDTRLVVEDAGVIFLGEDGVVLAYPHSEIGVAVTPVTGRRRWMLTPTETGGYQVWDRSRELIWHFAPEPELEGLDSRLGNFAVSAITDRFRNRIRFHYDRDGAPVEISHSGGYRVSIETASGRVTRLSVHDRGMSVPVREFTYSTGELVAVTNAAGATTRYAYDGHRMTAWTDSNGNQIVNTYDESGRVLFQRGTSGIGDADFDYLEFPDGTGSLTAVTDSAGAVTHHGFDHDLRLRDLIDPAGGRSHYDYNLDRHPLKVIGPDGAITHHRYTDEGDIAQITRPDGRTISFEYTFRGRPSEITDADGSVRQQDWDSSGNLAAVTDPGGTRTEYRYHPHGAVAETIGSEGARTVVEVDAVGLPVQVTDPSGVITRIDRDGFGRPILCTGAADSHTRYEWSTAGRLLRRTDPDGHGESWTYDGEGNLVTHTGRGGALTEYTYGTFDLLAARTDPDGETTHYRWDRQRRLAAVTNPVGETWTYVYDDAGRCVAETDFAGATIEYTYDRAGRVITVTPATGVTRHHTYDILGRPTEITADSGEWLRYTHDPAGRPLTAVSGTSDTPIHTLEFTYTAAGDLASQTLDDQPAMRHDYDRHGRRTTRTSPSASTTTWHRDHTGRVLDLTADGHTLTFTYDADRLTGWSVGELGIARTLTHLGRVDHQTVTAFPAPALNFGISTSRPAPRQLQRDEYTYRSDGYLVAHTISRGGTEIHHQEYQRDPIGRITEITSYAEHDASQHIVGQQSREYRNDLLVRNGSTEYEYDAAGRLVRKVTAAAAAQPPEVWHFRYNAFDQLVDVYTPDRQWWHYTYDALGRRTTKQHLATDGTSYDSVVYTWDGDHLIEEISADTTLRWQYQPNTHTAVTQARITADGPEFSAIISDPAGTPTALIDTDTGTPRTTATATVCDEPAWDGTPSIPPRSPGQIHNPETGLYHSLRGVYDPATGRFLPPETAVDYQIRMRMTLPRHGRLLSWNSQQRAAVALPVANALRLAGMEYRGNGGEPWTTFDFAAYERVSPFALLGRGDVTTYSCVDAWLSRDRDDLRIPVGVNHNGPVTLDFNPTTGPGWHLIVGSADIDMMSTVSFLRSIVLTLMATHAPADVGFVLAEGMSGFVGGFESAPHSVATFECMYSDDWEGKALSQLTEKLGEEIWRRERYGSGRAGRHLFVVLTDFDRHLLGEDSDGDNAMLTRLILRILHDGPTLGIHLVAECPPQLLFDDARKDLRTEFLRGLETVDYAYFAGTVASDAKALLGTEVPNTKENLGRGYLTRAGAIIPFLASDETTRIVETPDWQANINDVDQAVQQMPTTYFD